MKTTKITVLIISVVVIMTTIITGVFIGINYFFQKDNSVNKSYQQLKNLEKQFVASIHQLEHFSDVNEVKYLSQFNQFNELQKKSINHFKPECEKLQKELKVVNEQNQSKINYLFNQFNPIVNNCNQSVKNLKINYNLLFFSSKDYYQRSIDSLSEQLQLFLEQKFNSNFMSEDNQQKFIDKYENLKINFQIKKQEYDQNKDNSLSLSFFNQILNSFSTLQNKSLEIKRNFQNAQKEFVKQLSKESKIKLGQYSKFLKKAVKNYPVLEVQKNDTVQQAMQTEKSWLEFQNSLDILPLNTIDTSLDLNYKKNIFLSLQQKSLQLKSQIKEVATESLDKKYDFNFISLINQLQLYKNHRLNSIQQKAFNKIAYLKIDANDVLEPSQLKIIKNFFNFFTTLNQDIVEEILLTDNFKTVLSFWFAKIPDFYSQHLLSHWQLFNQYSNYQEQIKAFFEDHWDIFLSTLLEVNQLNNFNTLIKQIMIIYFDLLDHVQQDHVQQVKFSYYPQSKSSDHITMFVQHYNDWKKKLVEIKKLSFLSYHLSDNDFLLDDYFKQEALKLFKDFDQLQKQFQELNQKKHDLISIGFKYQHYQEKFYCKDHQSSLNCSYCTEKKYENQEIVCLKNIFQFDVKINHFHFKLDTFTIDQIFFNEKKMIKNNWMYYLITLWQQNSLLTSIKKLSQQLLIASSDQKKATQNIITYDLAWLQYYQKAKSSQAAIQFFTTMKFNDNNLNNLQKLTKDLTLKNGSYWHEWRLLNQQFDSLSKQISLSHQDVMAFYQETCHNNTIYQKFLSSAVQLFNPFASWYYSIHYYQQQIQKNSDFCQNIANNLPAKEWQLIDPVIQNISLIATDNQQFDWFTKFAKNGVNYYAYKDLLFILFKFILFIESGFFIVKGIKFLSLIGIWGKIFISSSILLSLINVMETIYMAGFEQLPIFDDKQKLVTYQHSKEFVKYFLSVIDNYIWTAINISFFSFLFLFMKKKKREQKYNDIIVKILN